MDIINGKSSPIQRLLNNQTLLHFLIYLRRNKSFLSLKIQDGEEGLATLFRGRKYEAVQAIYHVRRKAASSLLSGHTFTAKRKTSMEISQKYIIYILMTAESAVKIKKRWQRMPTPMI